MNSKNILVIFLILITVVLIGAAIFIGGQLGTTPDTDVSGGACCSGGSCIDSGFSFGPDFNFQGGDCNARKIAACGSIANTNGSDPVTCPDGGDGGDGGDSGDGQGCVAAFPNGVNGCIQVSGTCTILRFERNMTGSGDDCFTSDNGSSFTATNTTVCPNAPTCKCVQIDVDGQGGVKGGNWSSSCGSNPTTTTTATPTPTSVIRSCGDACTTDSQCPTNHSCSGNVCTLTACVNNPSLCESDGCTTLLCGNGETDEGEQCGEPGLTCAVGSSCNESTCNCTLTECGDTCSVDTECPTNHVCSGNVCRLPVCTTPGACSDNSCTPIAPTVPVTAIISDEADRIILGIVLIAVGFIVLRLGLIDVIYNFATTYPVRIQQEKIGKHKETFEGKMKKD